ncbi:MAG: DNA primase [Dehalococcoidia bacterium]
MNNIAEDVKQRLDIVSIVSEYVSLGKSGRNFRGLCPFHTEKTPSFFVFPERQSWRCFGCGAGGDMVSFVMKKEGLEFGEALRHLAPRAGVTIPEKAPRKSTDDSTPRIYQANEAAARYYQNLLLKSPEAEVARKYLVRRDLSEETVADFKLGYSRASWDDLKNHMKELGFSEKELVTAGLAIAREDRTYDRFRGRLMFPISDVKGRVIGFGARALDDSVPKYLNSSESPVFSKNSVLYGIDRAREAIREQDAVVIVEGYMDALTAFQNGFRNVVASMGTALTENQIAILKGITGHIYLSLDADTAGNAATLRGIEICRNAFSERVSGKKGWLGGTSELRAQISIISMPEGKDPDEVIRESPEEWTRLVKSARPLMDYLFEVTAVKYDLSRPEDKSRLARELLPVISSMKDSAVREEYLTRLEKLTGLSDEVLRGMLTEWMVSQTDLKQGKIKERDLVRTSRAGDQLEEYCLSLLLNYPALTSERLTPEHFERSENREVFIASSQSRNPGELKEMLSPVLHEHLDSLIERQIPPLDKRQQREALDDCVRRLEKRSLRYKLVFEADSALESGGDPGESSARLAELQRQHNKLG